MVHLLLKPQTQLFYNVCPNVCPYLFPRHTKSGRDFGAGVGLALGSLVRLTLDRSGVDKVTSSGGNSKPSINRSMGRNSPRHPSSGRTFGRRTSARGSALSRQRATFQTPSKDWSHRQPCESFGFLPRSISPPQPSRSRLLAPGYGHQPKRESSPTVPASRP